MGDIRIALEKERAPITVSNFLRYVDNKRFDGVNFYRAVVIGNDGKYGLIQGGPRGDPKAGEGIVKGQMLTPPVKILTVRRVDPAHL